MSQLDTIGMDGNGLRISCQAAVVCSALGQVSKLRDVAEHLCQGDTGVHHMQILAGTQLVDNATATVEISNDVALLQK